MHLYVIGIKYLLFIIGNNGMLFKWKLFNIYVTFPSISPLQHFYCVKHLCLLNKLLSFL